jgi:cold shock protein
MATGKVKRFIATKGYGFIQPDDGGSDVFVHVSALARSGMLDLVQAQKVSFDVEPDRRTGKVSLDEEDASLAIISAKRLERGENSHSWSLPRARAHSSGKTSPLDRSSRLFIAL